MPPDQNRLLAFRLLRQHRGFFISTHLMALGQKFVREIFYQLHLQAGKRVKRFPLRG
jgi:hypothetical protein